MFHVHMFMCDVVGCWGGGVGWRRVWKEGCIDRSNRDRTVDMETGYVRKVVKGVADLFLFFFFFFAFLTFSFLSFFPYSPSSLSLLPLFLAQGSRKRGEGEGGGC